MKTFSLLTKVVLIIAIVFSQSVNGLQLSPYKSISPYEVLDCACDNPSAKISISECHIDGGEGFNAYSGCTTSDLHLDHFINVLRDRKNSVNWLYNCERIDSIGNFESNSESYQNVYRFIYKSKKILTCGSKYIEITSSLNHCFDSINNRFELNMVNIKENPTPVPGDYAGKTEGVNAFTGRFIFQQIDSQQTQIEYQLYVNPSLEGGCRKTGRNTSNKQVEQIIFETLKNLKIQALKEKYSDPVKYTNYCNN